MNTKDDRRHGGMLEWERRGLECCQRRPTEEVEQGRKRQMIAGRKLRVWGKGRKKKHEQIVKQGQK